MYKRILVTLDRSQLAEQALPHALAIAQACEASVELLSIVKLLADSNLDPKALEAETRESEDYLRGIAARLSEAGLECSINVRQGDVADEILRFCEEAECDLIVMSTHGRSGLGRWVYGSIADRVLRYAEVPVLLVRATESE